MTTAVSGASGMIGRVLCKSLADDGQRVLRLVRRAAAGDDELAWDPARGILDGARLDGVDAIVHLAGANVGEGRWTAARKRELRDSRVLSTALLARAIAACARKPRVFVSASAIGWYGARNDTVDERAPRGDGFLAELCAEWEAAAEPARAAGVRVVHPRIGIVLSPDGGALAKMLPPFRLGLGAVLGDGTAPLSWVALGDTVAALRFAIDQAPLAGAVNVTSPEPTTQRGLAVALGRALHRPVLLRLPGALLRLAVGELAGSVLGAAAVVPTQLLRHGFHFAHPTLAAALDHALGVSSGGEAHSGINDGGSDRLQQ
ncbi:MAG TPA: TIGR01777 family oxidoreductase [Polyangia bacterium]|jgi:hypothetical protein|nr:TIGR01777 family oxidoreductase [Polyangia bacterium]